MKVNNRFVDMTGQKFNWLTVVEFSHTGEDHLARWICLCDCGNRVVVKGSTLRNGNTKSCGCRRNIKASQRKYVDMTGTRYGTLTILRDVGRRFGKVVWECACDCGNIINVPAGDIRQGKYISCGCRKKQGENNPKWKGGITLGNNKSLYNKESNKRRRPKINAYKRSRYSNDINYKILSVLRNRLRIALKGMVKAKSAKEFLGCSVEYLKHYLESMFNENMSWDNHGTYWEIDHIRPCASFDLSDPEQQKACFHYTNLQPLEGKRNREKSDFMDTEMKVRARNL